MKVHAVTYVVIDVMLVINLSLPCYKNYQICYHFYVVSESKTPSTFTPSTCATKPFIFFKWFYSYTYNNCYSR